MDFMDQVRRSGGRATDGRVPDDFDRGWARHPFTGANRAHFWTTRRKDLEAPLRYGCFSACGLWTVATQQVGLLLPGNYEQCRNCDRSMLASMRRTGLGLFSPGNA